jgi:hypothetical protein
LAGFSADPGLGGQEDECRWQYETREFHGSSFGSPDCHRRESSNSEHDAERYRFNS